MATPPNIVMIMTDQQRFDALSCVSDGLPDTPHLDGLAREGVRFDNAYAPSPVCAPARAAIKSGLYPPGCGVVGNWVPFHRDVPLLTHRLRAQGYETALVGKLHFVPHLGRFGFDWRALHDAPYSVYADDEVFSDYVRWLRERWAARGKGDPVALFDADEDAFKDEDWYRFIMGSGFRTEEEHETAWCTRQAERYLDERDPAKPFFLFLSYFGPHQPFLPPEPWASLVRPQAVRLPPQFDVSMDAHPVFAASCGPRAQRFRELFSRERYQRMVAAYYGQMSMIDQAIGQFLARLKRDGLWDNTVVIFCSDHGDRNGAYGLFFKGEMYDSCCKVPLIVRAPGAPAGRVDQHVLNTLDLYGTILDYAGDADWRQPGIEARSLAPLLAGPGAAHSEGWDNATYSIIGEDPLRNLTMLRRDHLKLIRLARGPEEALYELYETREASPGSPAETHNVYTDPAYAAEAAAMRAELDAWWRAQSAKYPPRVIRYRKA